jgi:hypothetical protein
VDNYLTGKTFNIYFSGVYNGSVTFAEKAVELCNVDRRTRVKLKTEPFDKNKKATMIDYLKIYEELEVYNEAKWEGDRVKLSNGNEYSRYLCYSSLVDGTEFKSQLWARRKSPEAIDIITVDGKIIAFSHPGRISSEIAVVPGYEKLTPLIKFDDPLLSKP